MPLQETHAVDLPVVGRQRRCSVGSLHSSTSGIVSIEDIHPMEEPYNGDCGGGRRMPRRRSSAISFEKSASVVMERMISSLIDDELNDDGSLDGIPTGDEAPEGPTDEASGDDCILSRFQDEIIEKQEVRSGKLVVDFPRRVECDQDFNNASSARDNQGSFIALGSSLATSLARLHRRTSIARRRSVGSAPSGAMMGRRASFSRSLHNSRRSSSHNWRRRGSVGSTVSSSRGASLRAEPSLHFLHNDIGAELRDLAAQDFDEDDSEDEGDDYAAIETTVHDESLLSLLY